MVVRAPSCVPALIAAIAFIGCGDGCGRAQTTAGVDRRTDAAVVDAATHGLSAAPEVGPPRDAELASLPATSLGLSAFTANARVQPHGLPTTYSFEYGLTAAYGSTTAPRSLPPRLTAFYREDFDRGRGGWSGGMSFADLSHLPEGGVARGHVRYVDAEGGGDDTNHLDGIGVVHLTKYLYVGSATEENLVETPSVAWAAGDPDLRDARMSIHVRGTGWTPNDSELVWWMQCDRDLAKQNEPDWRRANWAHTGFTLTDALASGKWERVEYRLSNDSNQWTYAGNSVHQNRPNYVYWSLDEALAHVNNDVFHMLVYVDQAAEPRGTIDYDELELAYRNHNLLAPSNGGKVANAPATAPDDARLLTDGWRNGAGRMWRSPPNPKDPVEITWELASPVTIERAQIHQHTDFPSRQVSLSASDDGKVWKTISSAELPRTAKTGPNFAFHVDRNMKVTARFVKAPIASGYLPTHWGLGEIEIFGTGATMQTDDDWYNVNQDVTGLKAATTYHFRVVAKNSRGTFVGPDQSFTVPKGNGPEVATLPARRIRRGAAQLAGRLNPLGKMTEYWFEYGDDTKYGQRTPPKESPKEAGLQVTPRGVQATIENLEAGKTIHYRLVASSAAGKSRGEDMTFTAK